ncbi:ferredoxin [Desulfatibacillum alkenivorans DSM 16219]|jgi:ferredoxin|uniref:Ferredoxin n=1 Tax=Desulfatibacillum alkenivorans DSM 16219 TaxID=1121393 RepID=A0A1M6E883_9BACT|nr:ferredoxin [Desulfatibacillum alkenivorans]SHI81672.1 ferredoxin [Desulfatibacillum alkenivorans DSM 16219]
MKVPVVDNSTCVDCEGCIEVCPEVFFRNNAGMIQVKDLDSYPEECVDEAIKYCPSDCITWEDE